MRHRIEISYGNGIMEETFELGNISISLATLVPKRMALTHK